MALVPLPICKAATHLQVSLILGTSVLTGCWFDEGNG